MCGRGEPTEDIWSGPILLGSQGEQLFSPQVSGAWESLVLHWKSSGPKVNCYQRPLENSNQEIITEINKVECSSPACFEFQVASGVANKGCNPCFSAYWGVPMVVCLWQCAFDSVPRAVCLRRCAYGGVPMVMCLWWCVYDHVYIAVFLFLCAYGDVPMAMCLEIVPLAMCLWWCPYGVVPL